MTGPPPSGPAVARLVIDAGAVEVDPDRGFVWSSGLRAPIYCDHRLLLGRPEVRRTLSAGLARLVRRQFPTVDGVAGVVLAAVPWAAWVAELLDLPLLVVRGAPKPHGRRQQVEGALDGLSSVVVVEDVVSTGGSARAAGDALRVAGVTVAGTAAMLDYRLPAAETGDLDVHALYTYADLREQLAASGRYGLRLAALDRWYAGLRRQGEVRR